VKHRELTNAVKSLGPATAGY